jgi:hypothetical protein
MIDRRLIENTAPIKNGVGAVKGLLMANIFCFDVRIKCKGRFQCARERVQI